jgi:hypothetical protein
MRQLLLVLSLVLLLVSVSQARDFSTVEVFGGYSFLHSNTDNSRINAHFPIGFVGSSTYLTSDGTANLNGWEGSISFNLNKWLGIVSDFSGHYGSMRFDEYQQLIVYPPQAPSLTRKALPRFSSHSFLFGPQLKCRKYKRIVPFAHVLFGVNREAANISSLSMGGSGIAPWLWEYYDRNETSFALAAGGGLDIKIGKRIAVRAFQADYLLNHRNDDRHNNVRAAAGLLFYLGGK